MKLSYAYLNPQLQFESLATHEAEGLGPVCTTESANLFFADDVTRRSTHHVDGRSAHCC